MHGLRKNYCRFTAASSPAAICWPVPVYWYIILAIFASTPGAIVVAQQKYTPPSFIRDIETMFEISQELPSNWLPVYLLHRSYPSTFQQDFPVYDFVHQFFVSVVSPNGTASVTVAELTPKVFGGYSDPTAHAAIKPTNRIITQIISEPNLWYLFVFKKSREGSLSVGTLYSTSMPLYIEIYGSSKMPQSIPTTTDNPAAMLRPNIPTPFRPFVTNASRYFFPPTYLPQYLTTRSPFEERFPPPAGHHHPPKHILISPPLLPPPLPPPLLTPRPTPPVVVVGPGGHVMTWPSNQPPLEARLPQHLPPVLVHPGAPWLQTTTWSYRLLRLNIFYLAAAFIILAFGTMVLCITLLIIFCCIKTAKNDEMQCQPGMPLSDTKAGLLFAFLILLSLILIVIGIGVAYIHVTHGDLNGTWWRPCRLSTAVVCCAVFLSMALAYAVAQFCATRMCLVTTPEMLQPKTIKVAPAETKTPGGRKEAWTK